MNSAEVNPVTNPRYRVVCLIARQCGVDVLKYLLRCPEVTVVGVFTHSKLPSSEDPHRGERPEFSKICEALEGSNIPLFVVNTVAEAKSMDGFDEIGEFDFLISLSWRFLVDSRFLNRSRLADINLHRGLLPKYGGSEPIRRMLEDGKERMTITAHIMVQEIDAGEILQEDHIDVKRFEAESLPDAVERIKKMLDPIYPFTAVKAMNRILQRNGLPQMRVEESQG